MPALQRPLRTTGAPPRLAAVLPARGATHPGTRAAYTPESRLRVADAIRGALLLDRSVLVVGDAGVGKTHVVGRVLDDVARGAAQRPLVVAVSGASARDGIPLAALEPLLGDDGLVAVGSSARIVRVITASLAERAGGRPVVLRVEDAHLLDDASAEALAWVVRQGEVLLVATSRRSGVCGPPWLELWKDDVVERVDVEPFTPAELEQWLAAELGGRATVDSARRVWSETRGNVFHARELVRAELGAGNLHAHDGVWVWSGHAAPGPRLLEIVRNDTSHLTADGRRALEVAALLCPAPLSLVLDQVPRAALDELIRTGVVTLCPEVSAAGGNDVVVDLAHALYADLVRTMVPQSRRREILEGVAGSAHSSSGPSLVRSVALALDSGLTVPHERLRAALAAAFALQQGETVVRLVDVALRGVAPAPGIWTELMLQRADAWWSVGETARADRDAREVCEVLRAVAGLTGPLAGQLVAATDLVAAVVHDRDDDVQAAVAVLDEALGWLRQHANPGSWEEELGAARLVRLGFAGRHETRDAARSALANPLSPRIAVRLVLPTVVALAHAGRFREGLTLCRRYLPVALAHTDRSRWAPGEVAVAAFVARLWSGDVERLESEEVVDVEPDGQIVNGWAVAQAGRGLLAIAEGAWSQAVTDLSAANSRLPTGDRMGISLYGLAAEALARAASGAGTRARDQLAVIDATPLRAGAAFEAEVRLLRVDTLAWLRDNGVRDDAAALAEWARERGLARVELEALHRFVRAGGLSETVGDRVARLEELVEGPRAAALVAHVTALLTGDADMARIAERDLNRHGLWLPPVEPPIALTPREREIAALAAGGMTSRAIANRLTLSVRTIDSHLARVFAKTGVHSREGLSAVLR